VGTVVVSVVPSVETVVVGRVPVVVGTVVDPGFEVEGSPEADVETVEEISVVVDPAVDPVVVKKAQESKLADRTRAIRMATVFLMGKPPE